MVVKEKKIEVRNVEVDDVFAIAKMLGKITKGAREEIASALSSNMEKTNPTEFALVLFQSLLVEADGDLKRWMADLCGIKLEEFVKLPAEVVIDVIEGLATQEGIKGFFARASLLASRGGKRLQSLKQST